MLVYLLIFLLPAFGAMIRLRPISQHAIKSSQDRWPFFWWSIYFFLVLIIGLRHEVGGDWTTYLEMLDSYTDNALRPREEYGFQDPAYVVLNISSVYTGWGIYLLNLISAGIFSYGLIEFCRSQTRQWLALTIAVPYLVTVVAMGYTRQASAIGIAMLAMIALERGSVLKFIILIGVAGIFHKSAVILLPLAFLASPKKSFYFIIFIGVAGLTLYWLVLQDSVNSLLYGYADNAMESSGAGVRIGMNAFPALLFLIYRKKFHLSSQQQLFWTWMSWTAILLVGFLQVSPSSTAVDRVALYWIPLQLFVYSRLPNALGLRDGQNALWVITILGYSATVYFVWLFYAKTAFAWLPYKFYPWVLLTQ